jgi:hypothetical protein
MKYSYTQEELKNYLLEGALDVLLGDSKFKALIVERKVAEDSGHIFVNSTGHDDRCVNGVKYETKYTDYPLFGNTLRINSAGENKRAGFDFIRIVDGFNKRIFLIPHDEYFRRGKFYGNEFRWSAGYNQEDKIQRENTSLLLQYEVTKF